MPHTVGHSSKLASNQICYECEQLAGKEKHSCQTNPEGEDVFGYFRLYDFTLCWPFCSTLERRTHGKVEPHEALP